jgi:hypothetical protein
VAHLQRRLGLVERQVELLRRDAERIAHRLRQVDAAGIAGCVDLILSGLHRMAPQMLNVSG